MVVVFYQWNTENRLLAERNGQLGPPTFGWGGLLYLWRKYV